MKQAVKEIENTPLPHAKKAWNPTDESFTVDQVIDAYTIGVNRGVSDLNTYIKKQLKENFDEIKKAVEGFLNEISPVCKSAFLKIEGLNSFKIIYSLQKDVYNDDKRAKPIYERSWEISQEFDKQGIVLGISFIPHTSNINLYRLSADGYHLSYGDLQ
jgi:hypothetical protein